MFQLGDRIEVSAAILAASSCANGRLVEEKGGISIKVIEVVSYKKRGRFRMTIL
jgi:hypothetical protein